ncbi:MAG TPA: hypothetical protein VI815_01625 [Candidatus Nanoarchaeia archaeon]|nr:hypothetical protein [Candidatus Nanoarchaeia archaeon]
MYNMSFYDQLQGFKTDLCGNSHVDIRKLSDEAHSRYTLPAEIKILPCKQNEHGEWIPSKLETSVDSL